MSRAAGCAGARLRGMALLVVGLLGPLVGCGAAPPEVGVAITSWPGYEYFYLAEQWQLAEPHGLRLRVRQFSSLEDQRLAYLRGDVDVVTTTLPDAIAVCQALPRRCPQLVLVLDESRGADVLVARRSDDPGLGGLRGQRLGLERSVLAEYMLLRALTAAQMGPQAVQLVYGGPTALVEGLRHGRLAAIITYPPFANDLVRDPGLQVLFSSAQIPGEIVDVLAVAPALAQRQPQVVRGLVATWWAARRQAAARPQAALALMAAREQVTPATFVASQHQLRYPGPREQLQLLKADGVVTQAIGRIAALMERSGRLPAGGPRPLVTSRWLTPP